MHQIEQLGPDDAEAICFCSRVEIRSETVNLYDRSAMAYNMVLLVFGGIALSSLYFLRIVPFAGLLMIGGVLIGIAPFYYVFAFITWARPYERLAKKSGLPSVDPDEATFFVVGDPTSWDLPEDVNSTPFEARHFPALAAYLLSPNISVEHIGFLLPTILIANGLQLNNTFQVVAGILILGFILFRFPWHIWYEVAPGQFTFMRESNLGLKAQLERRYEIADQKVIADFAKKRLILLGRDKTDVISLRNMSNAKELCYYVMLSRAAACFAAATNETEDSGRTNADTIGSRVRLWGSKKQPKE